MANDCQELEILVGKRSSDYVVVRTLEANRSDWQKAEISISAGPWKGSFEASLWNPAFTKLREGLEILYKRLKGTAEFESLEPQLLLVFSGDGHGHVRVDVTANAGTMFDKSLQFPLELDQTDLPGLIAQVKAVEFK